MTVVTTSQSVSKPPRIQTESLPAMTSSGRTSVISTPDIALPLSSRPGEGEQGALGVSDQPPIPPSPNDINGISDAPNPVLQTLSTMNGSDTPRSSGDFLSLSNNSSETLASEYIEPRHTRTPGSAWHSRQSSLLGPSPKSRDPEKIMMGYVQLSGNFSVDASLIDKSTFDETRRKGIVGDQGGGGLVREDAGKRESGFFGSFGWGGIGKPLEGLLGGNELSSIKNSKESDKNIPILSTPQSILFVDLQLAPGESKSFEYSHSLPKGIPPSHRGKALKVSYHLVIGTQRFVASTHKHHVQYADVPFQVLPGVNGKPRDIFPGFIICLTVEVQGDILGHDLMLPYTLLHNTAKISPVSNPSSSRPTTLSQGSSKQNKGTEQDFKLYVSAMLSRTQQTSSEGLLSPTETSYSSLPFTTEGSKSSQEIIDSLILRGNAATPARKNVTRFEIAKEGARAAVITLSRSICRLGDSVSATIDFTGCDVLCYSLHATLESSEVVDTSVALRSSSSIERLTRQIHASQSITTICARRIGFSPVIPVASTPTFLTSAVENHWHLRFEFITERLIGDSGDEDGSANLLQEVARDERATVSAVIHTLPCEAFDVSIPLTVYGTTRTSDERLKVHDMPI